MKYVISLVCLFFMMMNPQEHDFEDRINTLLNNENTEKIEQLSKEGNELYNEIEESLDSIQLNYQICQDKMEEYEKRYEFYQNKLNQFPNITVYMQSYQQDHSSSMLDSYQHIYSQVNRYQEKMENLKKKKDDIEELSTKYNGYLQTLNEFQQRLGTRFNDKEMQWKGQFNRESIIPGNDDLPVYGGYDSENIQEGMACLIAGRYKIDSYSDTWILPIISGTISAGTWNYPGGGLHLGLDWACSMYSNVRAPANGLILYADAPVSSNCGYLGNWVGWPYGGGNTICMICAVQNKLYMVTFAHLSNQIRVYPGQQVRQGDILALSGNSGNSTGPHCHIEVFRLNRSLEEVVSYFVQGADFSLNNGFNQPATCSQYACRIRPESVFGGKK